MSQRVPIDQAWHFLIHSLKRGVWVYDVDGVILEANSALEKWLEHPGLVGTNVAHWHRDHQNAGKDLPEVELVSESGIVRKFDVVGEDLLNKDGTPVSRIEILTDQVMSRALEGRLVDEVRRMARLAGEDSLTGLANRRAFDEALTTMQAECERKFGVLVVDLDDFKAVNDSCGHRVGDQVLVSYAEKLHQLVRGDDLVARIGGDEFAVLLPNVSMVQLTEAAERLRRDLVVEIEVNGAPLRVYSSVGYAHSGPDPTNVVERADKWMYQHKSDRESGGLAAIAEKEATFVTKTG